MLSLVEKLEDLKAGLNNDTYIDVILQSLPPSYDPFIINYDINGLEKSIHELINMLVQYEATTRKSEPSVLIGEASTSKAKGKGTRCWKRKKGKGTAVTATASTGGAPPTALKGKGKGKVGGSHQLKANDVLQRSRKLSKDEMILRLGDGKAVAVETVGSLSLVVSDHVRIELKDCYFVLSMVKNIISISMLDRDEKDDQEALCWTKCDGQKSVGLGPYICLWTLKYSGQRWILLLHNLTDDHSRYGYVYLMRYKSEAFGSFNEYRLEVENQTSRKIKALRSDRGGGYLSGEFIDYLKENGILSQWTPPGTPQLNEVAERRNRTLLDMVRSMMSFMELPSSFWGHALETAVRLLNISPSKSIPQTPYEIWHGKPASYKYLRVWGSPAYVKRLVGDKLESRSSLCRFIGYPKETAGYYFYYSVEQKVFVSRNAVSLEKGFPSDNQRDEVLIEESSGEPPHNSTAPFEPIVHTDSVPILHRSTRGSRVLERYGFVGLTNSPKGVRPVGCKWIYKRKLGANGEITTFKARLVAKGYTQRPGVDFEETYLPIAMAKSIRILLAIAA
ncbi:UNVERIFIED_CONTAM: Retrovirus-related Pol polyprotein from transposon RE2 [Sesamum radiatum]|uniref:Retrovirus-related Pol polyprotein from transposon RE2 n=1 Tax=Sesamum radiatum TaxID=300843 RepID=A0AAW2JK75_SESRA